MKRLFLGVLSLIAVSGLALGISFSTYNSVSAEELACSATSTAIVSDSSTMVNGSSSMAVDNDTVTPGNQVPGPWTASIPGATWIWSDAQNDGAAATGTEVFTREFTWSSDATTSATLMIAADNTYSVEINGNAVGSSSDEINFTLDTQDTYDVSQFLVNGTNTLEIAVTNADNGMDNPAGLLYKLDIDGYDCEVPEVDQPTGEIIEPDAGDTVSGTTTLLASYNDHDAVNDDTVQWAVRSDGACDDPTKTVFGNVDGHSDSYSWDGASFSSVIDTESVANGQYCFVFNPTDDAGQNDVRLTSIFTIMNEDEGGEQQEEKVTICHIPPGNPSKAKTLSIDADDVQSHLNHGDYQGECSTSSTSTLSSSEHSNKGKGGR